MTESIDEDEKLKLQIVVAGQRREVLMLTEDEKLVHQIYGAGQRREVLMLTEDEKVRYIIPTLGGMQRNKYVWRILS